MKGLFAKIKLKYVLVVVSILFMLDFFGAFTHIMEADYHSRFSYPLDIDLTEVLDFLRNNRQPSVQPINEYNYRFTIANEAKCKDENAQREEKITLLYLIKSALGHKSQRDAIRNSWGFEKRFSDVQIRRVFVLGTESSVSTMQSEIDDESKEHQDIVQADFIDTYFNNTIKTLMGFHWVVKYCPKTQFIFLVDDDMYVSTKNLLKFLRNPLNLQMVASRNKFEESLGGKNEPDSFWWNMQSSEVKGKPIYDGRLYAGFVFFSSPLRHKTSKWYISLNEYPYSKYPPYVTAGAVSLTYLALLDMYYASRYTKHFRFDDIYMGILAKKVGIHPIHNSNVYFYKKGYSREAFANVIASHGFQDPRELIRTWEEQRSLGNA